MLLALPSVSLPSVVEPAVNHHRDDAVLQELLRNIPDKNTWYKNKQEAQSGHRSKPYYSCKTVFTEPFIQCVDQLVAAVLHRAFKVDCISPTLPNQSGRRGQLVRGLLPKQPNEVRIVMFPMSNKCIKCNRAFYFHDTAIGELAFQICHTGSCTEIYADKCLRCTVLHWLLTKDDAEQKADCHCKIHRWNLMDLHVLVPKKIK